MKNASAKGQQVVQNENYEIVKTHVSENSVILEIIWTAELLIPIGKLPVGGIIKAYFAQVYEFENGKIIRQRNYDCFEPFN